MPHHYGIVYQDLKGVITWAYDHPTASTVYSHKMGLKFGTQELSARSPWTKMLNGTANYILDTAR